MLAVERWTLNVLHLRVYVFASVLNYYYVRCDVLNVVAMRMALWILFGELKSRKNLSLLTRRINSFSERRVKIAKRGALIINVLEILHFINAHVEWDAKNCFCDVIDGKY